MGVLNNVELAKLQGAGFKPASTTVPRRLIVSASGKPKEGKTHFALTFPEPIFLFDVDTGTEGVVEKFRNGSPETGQPKEIHLYPIRVPSKVSQDKYETLWRDVQAKLEVAWSIGKGTVVIDTSSECYELSRLAKFGKLAQVQPYHYTEVNVEWKELMKKAFDAEQMNTVFIHRLKKEYINNAPTGRMEVAGYGEVEYQTQINLVAYRDPNVSGGIEISQGIKDYGFRIFIKDCRRNSTLNGMVLKPPMPMTAEMLMSLVHG